MIITKTPLRISFAGGGSDIKDFYDFSIGSTLSTAINKYVYVCVKENFNSDIRLSYSKTEIVDHVDKLEHDIVRECLKMMGIENGIEIVTMADIPSKGTGLGSSSSFTVGLLHALHAYKGEVISPEQLAQEACKIEIETMKKPIGKQDQYIAAYGGLRFMKYLPNDHVAVDYVFADYDFLQELEGRILLFYTGITRDANIILRDQVAGYRDEQKMKNTKKMVLLAHDLRVTIENKNFNDFGRILHELWLLKKTLSKGITNDQIDEMYNKALANGAEGGKLLGAGGGGFLLIYAQSDKHQGIINALSEYKLIQTKFDKEGSKILFINKNI